MRVPAENFSTVEDFLNSDVFRTWILERRPEDQVYWQEWLALHPDKRDLYEQAVATLLVLQGKRVTLSNQQVKNKAGAIVDRLPDSMVVTRPLPSWQWGRWVAAATVVGFLVLWLVNKPAIREVASAIIGNQQSQPTSTQAEDWKIVKNYTGVPLIVLLPDQSSVLLSTNSQLRYRKQNQAPLREVFLQGEGFFEVTKNPARPFIVYTTNLTTKVLGTSFQVRSFAKELDASVKVKTGKVSVIPVDTPSEPILLTVNQQLRIETKTDKVVKQDRKAISEQPSALLDQQFAFSYTPIPEVFDQLEGSYHMPIKYNRELLKRCTFTGQLIDAPFLEKIKIICLAIDSTYEIVDNQLIIRSRGCS
ncbi:iron dicitrate transport regulator FecR [Spirosoma agri]|uniref:Iron dicitrate transport regulator FecR n=1 Tax=Spirosoma agri TaxID=1987381 RepID=A0A6M0IPC1_9BACT|nr:FecR family protein [Spirosoma agri]NEU70179.1 iron dicitrate transport regulator FecR [Spirosoma agri]